MIGFIDRPVLRLSGRLSEHGATLLSGPHCSSQPKTLRWYEFDMTVKCQLCTYMQGPAPFQLLVEWKDRGGERDRGGEIRWRSILKGERAGLEDNLLQESGVCYFADPYIVNKTLPLKHWWAIKRLLGCVFFSLPASLSHLISLSYICDGLIIVISSRVSKLQKTWVLHQFHFNAAQIRLFYFTC